MHRPDLSNRVLVFLVGATAAIIVAYFAVVQSLLPIAWRTPGSTPLYVTGVAGASFLLVAAVFSWVKRTGSSSPPAWFCAHVVATLIGAILICIHSAGYLRRPPAALLAVLALAILVGLWGRVLVAQMMARTFSSKRAGFAKPDADLRRVLHEIIVRKHETLLRLDPGASEATFSVTLSHWVRRPWQSLRYARLARAEAQIIGTQRSVPVVQASWRFVHLVLAILFIGGLIIHVITVTFFAGYVSGYKPVHWWHLRAW